MKGWGGSRTDVSAEIVRDLDFDVQVGVYLADDFDRVADG